METGAAPQAAVGQGRTIREMGAKAEQDFINAKGAKSPEQKKWKTSFSPTRDRAQEETIEKWCREGVTVYARSVGIHPYRGVIVSCGPYSIHFRTDEGWDVCLFKTGLLSVSPEKHHPHRTISDGPAGDSQVGHGG